MTEEKIVTQVTEEKNEKVDEQKEEKLTFEKEINYLFRELEEIAKETINEYHSINKIKEKLESLLENFLEKELDSDTLLTIDKILDSKLKVYDLIKKHEKAEIKEKREAIKDSVIECVFIWIGAFVKGLAKLNIDY